MTSSAKPIPEGYHAVTPYLIVKDAASAVEFYKMAFGATEVFRATDPEGKVSHAEIKIHDSMIMIGQHQNIEMRSAESLPAVSIYLYVEDVDTVTRQAIAAGAKENYPVKDEPWGDRQGGVEDPFGIVWWIATHKEDVQH